MNQIPVKSIAFAQNRQVFGMAACATLVGISSLLYLSYSREEKDPRFVFGGDLLPSETKVYLVVQLKEKYFVVHAVDITTFKPLCFIQIIGSHEDCIEGIQKFINKNGINEVQAIGLLPQGLGYEPSKMLPSKLLELKKFEILNTDVFCSNMKPNQILCSVQPMKAVLRYQDQKIEVDLSFIGWAMKVGLIQQDFVKLAQNVDNSGDVYFMPQGKHEGGILIGFGTNTTKQHLSRAFVDAICFRILNSIEEIGTQVIDSILTDGLSDLPQQILADISNKKVLQIKSLAVVSAALEISKNMGQEITNFDFSQFNEFKPQISKEQRTKILKRYQEVIQRSQLQLNETSPFKFSEDDVDEFESMQRLNQSLDKIDRTELQSDLKLSLSATQRRSIKVTTPNSKGSNQLGSTSKKTSAFSFQPQAIKSKQLASQNKKIEEETKSAQDVVSNVSDGSKRTLQSILSKKSKNSGEAEKQQILDKLILKTKKTMTIGTGLKEIDSKSGLPKSSPKEKSQDTQPRKSFKIASLKPINQNSGERKTEMSEMEEKIKEKLKQNLESKKDHIWKNIPKGKVEIKKLVLKPMVSSIKSRSSSPLKQVNEVPAEQIISQRKNMEVDENSKNSGGKQNSKN